MELKETIDLMNSEDYTKRFKAEYYQLKIRRDKLHKIIIRNMAYNNGFPTITPQEILQQQEEVMNHYLNILEIRAEFEKIEL